MTNQVTQIIVAEDKFAAVEKFLESKEDEFRAQTEKAWEDSCGVEFISAVLVTRDKSRVKGRVIVAIRTQGLDKLEGQIDFSADLTSYLPELEKLGATSFGSHQSQND